MCSFGSTSSTTSDSTTVERRAPVPHAETSPVRRQRKSQQLTQKALADRSGLSTSTVGKVERERNPGQLADLRRWGITTPKTTIEVTVRLAAALGLMQYGQNYTLEQVARMQKLIHRRDLSERPARCKRPFPGQRHLRVVA
ncbi:TPA: hypothetical protein DIV49_03550 [Candidatus Saccharibacteria bacterium]|nr:hypothetical protein [Candidatus Saccharibacteria bacterium]